MTRAERRRRTEAAIGRVKNGEDWHVVADDIGLNRSTLGSAMLVAGVSTKRYGRFCGNPVDKSTKTIVMAAWCAAGWKQSQVAERFGVTRQRVHQVSKAFLDAKAEAKAELMAEPSHLQNVER